MDHIEPQSAGQASGQRDVSRQTMVVLVILAIVVSLLGTFTVLSETSGINKLANKEEAGAGPTQSANGMISLNIAGSEENTVADSATGFVTFTIETNN